MLTIPKRFPIVKVSSLGLGVFAIGFVGSIALLTYFHPRSLGEGGTNVATQQSSTSNTTDTKKAVASTEPSTSVNAGRGGTTSVAGMMPEKNTAAQPAAKYTPPAPAPSASTTPVATTGGSSSAPVLSVTTAPSSSTPLQVAPQPAPSHAPSPTPSTTGNTSPLPQTVQVSPVINAANGLTGSLGIN